MVPKKFILVNVLMLFVLTFLSFNAFAVNDWSSINNEDLGNTQLPYYSVNWSASTLQGGNYQSVATGSTYSPSVLDIDYDSVNELITYSGSNVFIYNGSSNILNLETTIPLNGTIKNIVATTLNAYSLPDTATISYGKTIKTIVALTSTNVYVINYLNSQVSIYVVNTLGGTDAITSNIACGVDNRGSPGESFCGYFLNTTNLRYFHSPDFWVSSLNGIQPSTFNKTYTGLTLLTNTSLQLLVVSDVDTDGTDEFNFIDATHLYSKLYDSASLKYNNTITTNIGQPKIYKNYIVYYGAPSVHSQTLIYKDIPTGSTTTMDLAIINAVGQQQSGGFILINGTTQFLSTIVTSNIVVTNNSLYNVNGTRTNLASSQACSNDNTSKGASGNLKDGQFNMLKGQCLFNQTGLVSASFSSTTSPNWLIADITGDYVSEIIEYKSGLVGVGFSKAIQVPNSLQISATPSGGFSGYYSPICTGTTITYGAKECLSSPYIDCNYFNSFVNERERLASTCGFGVGQPVLNGSFSYVNPTLDCTYTNPGTYTIFVYIQTESNPTDYAIRNPTALTINVSSGTPGVDCNINYVSNPTFNTTPVVVPNGTNPGGNITFNDTPVDLPDGYVGDSMWNAVWTGLLGQSPLTRLILGAVIIFLGVLGMLKFTQNPTFLLIGFACMLLIVFAMQLIPLWVPALLVVIWLSMWALNKSLGHKKE
jgi:hypothetical protein